MLSPAILPGLVGSHFMKSISTICMRVAVLSAVLGTGACIGYAAAEQPHMTAALDALRTARSELVASTPNKGGHRERAIQLVNQAIDETNTGIAFVRGR
jgi:hypothetical protein